MREIGLEVPESPTAIVPFSHGSFSDMRAIQECLFDEKIYVLHSNYIASGPGGAIRLSVFADHSIEDLNRVVEAIQAAI